ncbi:50S ribosomal protein L13 [Candidatus Saccharibacteria bacterium]|nr:50S ribosomal protein L13 [Candidatus Saccharibacteria bacterium]
MNLNKTYQAKPKEITPNWYVIDATDIVLGRLATVIARKLTGKDKPEYSPHAITGDCIIVVNAAKVAVTGNKLLAKKYYSHSGYPGGLTEINLQDQLIKKPEYVIQHAVKGMLPKNKLADKLMGRLHVFAGPEHDNSAQQPVELKVK